MTSHTVEIELPGDCDVEQAGETVTVEVSEGDYVLDAARRAGVWLPADCQQGWCTTCAAELLSGDVDQSDARRYYDVDAEAGLFLPCTARPNDDLHVRACQYERMLRHRADHDLPPGSSKL